MLFRSVIQPGLRDPFDYGKPVYGEPRPISEDMSYTVDDTFSFIRHGIAQRQRVDSEVSTFSFHAPPSAFGNPQQRRNRRQVDSMISVTSGPPVSLYNRQRIWASQSQVEHREIDGLQCERCSEW